MKFCPNCGNRILPGKKFCSRCGTSLPVAHVAPPTLPAPGGAVPPDLPTPPSAGPRAAPGLLSALRDPAHRPAVVKAIILGLAKSLGLSAAVLLPGLLLLAVSTFAGMAWLFAGSFLLMFRTYAKPWRLMWITCLTPAVASGFCFIFQLYIFRERIPAFWLLLPCAAIGLVLGMLRARSHELSIENGGVIAKRTAGYLIVWAVCYGVTQLLGMWAKTIPLVKGGLLTSALSTSMLVCVSIVILFRFLRLSPNQRGGIA